MTFEIRELRNAMGRFATGVCLITVASEDGPALALTANSFSSVSLEPPLLLWCLQDNSDVYDVYAAPRYYAINVLASEQEALSTQYARKGEHALEAAHYANGKHGAPLIRDALVSFECQLEATHDGGDHLIVIGRIVDMQQREGGDPLLFFSGGYRGIS